MDFSESVKLKVQQKADFACCICRQFPTDVHHIVEKQHGGPNDIDNAAPLCGQCHSRYGANPELRKRIRLARDHWYETCKQRALGPNVHDLYQRLGELGGQLESMQEGQAESLTIQGEIQSTLKALSDTTIERLTPETTSTIVSGFVGLSTGTASYPGPALFPGPDLYPGIDPKEPLTLVDCPRCGRWLVLTSGEEVARCAYCGAAATS